MNSATTGGLIPQAVYAKSIRSMLPQEAFEPDPSKLFVLLLNMTILLVGWGIAAQLDSWPRALLVLYLPFALVMANCVVLLAFIGHDLMHGSVVRNRRLTRLVTLFSQAVLWMPPTLWKHLHNRAHHNHTNALTDPDRCYLHQHPNVLGKRVQTVLVPSVEVTLPGLMVGLVTAWGVHACRYLVAVLLYPNRDCPHVTAQLPIKPADRFAIALELLLIAALHLSLVAYLGFSPLQLALGYFLPIGLGYAVMIFYIYTNHMACPMTGVNDPLVNSLSLRVPKFVDFIHCNFSHHAEHHIFPGLNSDYYPLVRTCIAKLYPERVGYVVPAMTAWRWLLATPRHYLSETTFTDWHGQEQFPCPSIAACDLDPASRGLLPHPVRN